MSETSDKLQIVYIHGGMTFKNKEDYVYYLKNKEIALDRIDKWNNKYLKTKVGDYFDIIKPRMPLQEDAQYEEWKIVFERYLKLLNDNLILIGSSLGGIFLSKYLSENKCPKKLLAVYMVCPPFDNSLPTEDLVGGFDLGEDLSLIMENCKHTRLMFSKDDDVVPVSQAELYREKLPDAEIFIYESKGGHFIVEEFPEIIEMIKEDYARTQ